MPVPRAAESAVFAFVDGIGNFPTPPVIFSQIVKAVDAPDSSADRVARLLSEDPGMAAAVLRVTNSSFYALDTPVSSVQKAVVVIGMDAVKSLVVSASVMQMFSEDSEAGQFQEVFWRHSLAAAFGARMLLRILRPADIAACEQAFTGGLLHDIGKMALYLQDAHAYREVTRRAEDKLEDELDAERELFGFDHAEVGAALMIKWNLPKELALAIGHHHDPLAMEDPGHLVDALHLADALAYHLLAAGQADGVAPAIQPAVFDRSGLKLEDLGRYMEGLKTEYYGAETFLSLVRTGDF